MLSALMDKSIIDYLQCDRQMLPFADMAKNILILLLPTRQLTSLVFEDICEKVKSSVLWNVMPLMY